MPRETRKMTGRLLEAIKDGTLDRDTVINALLNVLSEADVADLCWNEFGMEEDDDQSPEDEEEDEDTD